MIVFTFGAMGCRSSVGQATHFCWPIGIYSAPVSILTKLGCGLWKYVSLQAFLFGRVKCHLAHIGALFGGCRENLRLGCIATTTYLGYDAGCLKSKQAKERYMKCEEHGKLPPPWALALNRIAFPLAG